MLQSPGAITLVLGLSVTNASTGCNPSTLSITATAAVTAGPTPGGVAVVAPGVFDLVPRSTGTGNVTVTLPAGQAVGKYTISVTLTPTPGSAPFSTRVCSGQIAVTSVFEMRELFGNLCVVPNFEVPRKFRIVNQTGVARTINWTVTSTQNASSPGVDDHFPIELCGLALGAGNPLSTTIPSRTGVVALPAGVNSFVDVCINTRAYGGCQGGSNCCITIAAIDLASGQAGCANSDVTAVGADWVGCPVWGRSGCDGGLGTTDWACDLDPLTDEPNNVLHLGVEHLNGLLYVSAGRTTPADNHKVYIIDENCCLVGEFDQVPAAQASGFGYRDGASDGSSLAFGLESGIYLMDTSGNLVTSWATLNEPGGTAVGGANLPANPITGPGLALIGNYRALAYDPEGNGGNGSFWSGNFGSQLIEIDLAGNLLTTHPNGGWSAYGLALDGSCPNSIWVNSAPNAGEIAEIDVVGGALTGTSFGRRSAGSVQGGLTAVPGGWAGSGHVLDLIGLDQAAPDGLSSYRIHLYPGVNGKRECKLVTQVTNANNIAGARDGSDKNLFNGESLSWGFSGDPSLNGRPALTMVAFDLGPFQDATRRASTFGIPELHILNALSSPYVSNVPIVVGDGFGAGGLFGMTIPIGPALLGDPDAGPFPLPGPGVSTFVKGDLIKLQAVYAEPNSLFFVMATNAVYFRFCGDPPPCSGTDFENLPLGTGVYPSLWTPGSGPASGALEWTVNSGGTPSTGTGPAAGAGGSGQYYYCEVTGNTNGTFVFETCSFDVSGIPNPNLNFELNMNGIAMGQLQIEIIDAFGLPVGFVFGLGGDQGPNWFPLSIPLSSTNPSVRFRFTYQGAGGFQGDLAIDNIDVQ